MKTYAEALEPDARYRIVMTDDPVDGLRPLSFRDHYDMVADLELPAGAPDVVVRIYARALNALIYGWLDYELMVVAAGQALASLEFALKTRLGADARKMPGLARRLGYAVDRNILSPPQKKSVGRRSPVARPDSQRDRPRERARLSAEPGSDHIRSLSGPDL
ncbi:hypothetical protein [uncultured Brevundimonas sp.]|uniref:hypothetical protein n=1 Tax=uncultured Brevundimonas sp. TaxID=213418 RepID=UPI0025DDCD04|nr:hypothetical protein [uncultured Brevundimonas sp.]